LCGEKAGGLAACILGGRDCRRTHHRTSYLVCRVWFSGLLLVAVMVICLLVFAKVWSRMRELLLPIGFVSLLLSTLPQVRAW
jgi:hypothetical protein